MASIAAKTITLMTGKRENFEHGAGGAAAESAILAEAQRQGFGADYDAGTDPAGIAAQLIHALTQWQEGREGTPRDGGTPEGAAVPVTTCFATLCARWMHCHQCRGNERFIVSLFDGRVAELTHDLTLSVVTAVEAHETTVLCGSCGHTGALAEFRKGQPDQA